MRSPQVYRTIKIANGIVEYLASYVGLAVVLFLGEWMVSRSHTHLYLLIGFAVADVCLYVLCYFLSWKMMEILTRHKERG